jgi:peptidyl-prolyl cis-trans isomerase A (cyclophilin A)
VSASDRVQVVVETAAGDIELEIDLMRAPVTAGNFLRYVDAGLYTEGSFYRTVKPDNQPDNDVRIEVIQGGIDSTRTDERFPPIALERTAVTGLRHLDGTVSMSRFAPDSAHSEIFICIGDQPELDFGGRRYTDGQGFAAFGRVTRGMDVVHRIQLAPAEVQHLVPPVPIRRVRRLRGTEGA